MVPEELLAVVVVRGPLVGLGERRVDVDGRGEGSYGDVLLHGEDYLVDQVPRVRAYDVAAQDPAPPAGDDLDEPCRLAIGHRPVHPAERLAEDLHVVVLLAGLLLGEPDPGHLGVGKGRPRDDAVIHLRLDGEKGVPEGVAGLVLGDVGEEVLAGYVPGRVDIGGGGPQVFVYSEALLLHLDPGVLQAQGTRGGGAASGHQDLLAARLYLVPGLVPGGHHLLAVLHPDLFGAVTAVEPHAVGQKYPAQD